MKQHSIKLYILDARLPTEKALATEVKFTYAPLNESQSDITVATAFALIASSQNAAEPANVMLVPGWWIIHFTAYDGSPATGSFEVREVDTPQDIYINAADSDLTVAGTSLGKGSEFKSEGDHTAQFLDSSELPKKMRFLAPSRGDFHRSSYVPIHNSSQHVYPVARLNIYSNKEDSSDRPSFLDCNNFDDKLAYWFHNWNSMDRSPSSIPAKCWKVRRDDRTQVSTARLTIPADEIVPFDGYGIKTTLTVALGHHSYLVMLPLPCIRSGGTSNSIDIEFDYVDGVDLASDERLIQVRLFTDNPKFNATTQFLGSGNISAATRVWNQAAHDLLWGKYVDPMSAAAGALVLTNALMMRKAIIEDQVDDWLRWLGNLYRDFRWLPEGAICQGWVVGSSFRLRAGTYAEHDYPDDMQQPCAAKLFGEAVERGIPTFSEAVRLLAKGSEWASSHMVQEVFQAVHWLAMNTLPGSALVTIRIPRM